MSSVDTEPGHQAAAADPDKDDDAQEVVGVRESADGGPSPQQAQPGSAEEDNGSAKEKSKDSKDLDKDIDAVLEYNVDNGQIDPDGSITIDSISVESVLDTTKNLPYEGSSVDGMPTMSRDSSVDGMPTMIRDSSVDGVPTMGHDGGQQPEAAGVDVNGNVEAAQGFKTLLDDSHKTKETTGSEKSFTSDTTDSSVVAETLVRNALNVAVTAMKSEEGMPAGMVEEVGEDEKETDVDVIGEEEKETDVDFIGEEEKETDVDVIAPQGDVKVGLFQYDFGKDYQDENGGYEDDYSDEKEDEPDETEKRKKSDPQVGLFQYQEPFDVEESTGPAAGEVDTIEDQVESITEEERADIMKLYGLDNTEAMSPKSPVENDIAKPEMKVEKQDSIIDVQRDIYEPQTKKFVITRDPSSSESTPRNGGENFKPDTKPAEAVEKPILQDSDKEVIDVLSDRDEQTFSDSKKLPEMLESLDIKPQLYSADPALSDDVAPPLVQYEPVKENGKFRIIKTAKEGGSSSYTTIRVGTPDQSPRSGSEDGQKSDRSGSSARGIDVSPRPVQSPPVQTAQDIQQQHPDVGPYQTSHQARQPATAEGENLSLASSLKSQNSEARADAEVTNTEIMDSWNSKPALTINTEIVLQERSPKHLRLSELSDGPEERRAALEAERDRIKYMTRNTDGVETRRTGPVPYDVTHDQQTAARRGIDGQHSQSYSRDRHERVPNDPAGRFSASYREELIQSAYSRLPKTQDVRSKSLPGRSVDAGVIPGFKTLQEQQASWAGMFRQLEDQHRRELRGQYDHHQYNIQRLQQQMELELQKQHAAIRKKLDIHREKLDQIASPDRDARVSPGRRYRSDDRSPSAKGSLRPPDESHDRRERSQSTEGDLFVESKTWREIYREVRAEEDRRDSTSPPPLKQSLDQDFTSPPPLKRSLDQDFATIDSSVNETRASQLPESQSSRPSRYSISGKRDDSDDRSRSRERSYERSRDRSLEMSRSDGGRLRSDAVEVDASRSSEKELRSKSHRSEASPRYEKDEEPPKTIGQFAAESVSQHIQQLLDNLQDTRTSLRHLEGDVAGDQSHAEEQRPRAGVYSSPMPMFKGRGNKSSSKSAYDISKSANTSQEHKSHDHSRFSADQSRVSADHSRVLADQSRLSADQSRVLADQSRVSADHSRVSADQSRLSADQSQVSADQSRFSADQSRGSADQSGGSGDPARASASQSRLSSLFEDRAELHEDSLYVKSERQRRDKTRASESLQGEDLSLSSRERLNLREKHSKHLADLRGYYEDELRELRKALTDSIDSTQLSADVSAHSAVQGQLLEAENKHLLDKCRTMEDELEELYTRVRTLEQKNHGLEKRASEYAAAFTESQTMAIQHQAHIEELQRYCRERDVVVADLESKVTSQEDSVKIYRKNLEEEFELHRQDKIALQRVIDKYESLEREFNLLQETMNTTETRLYEARTEVVELNRTMSKMELENKRINRENDNLRHKITQSLNLSALHDSFGSPSSPRTSGVGQSSSGNINHNKSPSVFPTSSLPTKPRQTDAPLSADPRVPGFATSTIDWSTSSQSQKPKSLNQSRSRPSSERTVVAGRQGSSESLNSSQMKGESAKSKKRPEPKGSNSNNSSRSRAQKEDGGSRGSQKRSEHMNGNVEHVPTRDISPPARDLSPPRAPSEASLPESDTSDFSPLLKAERELFKLRDMMRQAVAVKPTASPPEPKLQKKFYGSERPGTKDDYHPDMGPARGRKDKPTVSSHSTVPKTKSSSQISKSDKTADRGSKKSSSGKSDKSDKSDRHKDRAPAGRQKDARERTAEVEDKRAVTPTKKQYSVSSEVYGSPTRFDININDDRKSVSVSQKRLEPEPSKPKSVSRANQTREETPGANGDPGGRHTGGDSQLESMLDRVRGGQYMARPEWEDVFTSLAKPRPENQDKVKAMTKEESIKERLRSISEMESRYDGLQVEKRQLESTLNKIPLHGRVDRNSRRQKEETEGRLDVVEKELGSLRMTLKRYNVLKTAS